MVWISCSIAGIRPSYVRPETGAAWANGVAARGRGRNLLPCGAAGDTTGNSPGTKWAAFTAIAEQPGLRTALHQPDQPGAAVLRGHGAQAASVRPNGRNADQPSALCERCAGRKAVFASAGPLPRNPLPSSAASLRTPPARRPGRRLRRVAGSKPALAARQASTKRDWSAALLGELRAAWDQPELRKRLDNVSTKDAVVVVHRAHPTLGGRPIETRDCWLPRQRRSRAAGPAGAVPTGGDFRNAQLIQQPGRRRENAGARPQRNSWA